MHQLFSAKIETCIITSHTLPLSKLSPHGGSRISFFLNLRTAILANYLVWRHEWDKKR